jgi:hypothetical protein
VRPIASSAEIVVRRIIAEDLSSYLELLSQGHEKRKRGDGALLLYAHGV